MRFLRDKSETFLVFSDSSSLLVADKGNEFGGVSRIRADHGVEFEYSDFNSFYTQHEIKDNFFYFFIFCTKNATTKWSS